MAACQELRTIRLNGELGKKFGRVHKLAVNSPHEAVRALSVLIKGFQSSILKSHDKGIGYHVFVGKKNVSTEEVNDISLTGDIKIAPVVIGSKKGGLFTVILGAALFFAAPYLVNPATATLLGEGGAIAFGANVATAGKLLLLAGAAQLLSPTQKTVGTADGPDNGASYNFNGAVNTTAQGNCIPVAYGKPIVGSAVISVGIYSEDQQ